MEKVKICVITAAYPLDGIYDGIFVKDHSLMLKRQGFKVSVLYAAADKPTRWPSKGFFDCVKRKEDSGLNVYINYSYRFAATYTVPLLKKSICYSTQRLFDAYVQDNGMPSIIIAHFSYPAGIGAAMIAQQYDIPLITIEHLSIFMKKKSRWWIDSEVKKVFNISKKIICVSEGLKNALLNRFNLQNEKVEVVPNIVGKTFKYCPNTRRSFFSFLSVGSLRKIKNFELLIDAFDEAFHNSNDVILKIAGDGPQEKKLKRIIEKKGLESKVILLGEKNRELLIKEYEECNSFILLSKAETFGIVYREAMAVGRPIISTNNGGIVYDGWDEKLGIVLENNDKYTVCDAMKYMINNFEKYDGMYISNMINERYSEEVVGHTYLRIINSIMADRGDVY